MAVAYRCGTVGGTTTNTTAFLAMTIPTSGSGGTTAAGDVGFACIETGGSNTYSAVPSGWTQRALFTNAQSNITMAIFSKTLLSGDINAALNWQINAANTISASIDVFSGVDEASCVYSTSLAVGTGASLTNPTITVGVNGLIFGFWGGAVTAGAAFSFTKPSSYTLGQTRGSTVVSGSNRTMGTAYLSVPGGGSTAGSSATFSASTSRNAALSIGIAATADVVLSSPTTNDVTIAAPAGTVSAAASVTATGTVADVTMAAAPGAVATSAGITLAGTVSDLVLAAPAGSVSTGVGAAGPVANLGLSAPAGSAGSSYGGPVASIATAAPAGGKAVALAEAGTLAGTSVTNAFPNPDCISGGTPLTASLTTVTMGSTEYTASGVGSAKVVVGASPTTSTFAYQPIADTDPASNGHGRYAAASGDTFDFLFTVKASASNAASVNILPKLAGYHWNGSATVSSASGDTNGTAILLAPGEEAVVAQRITVVTPPVDTIDGILAIPHIRSGSNLASAPAAGSIIYLDRMMLVRNSPRALSTSDYLDGDQNGTWNGTAHASSSTGVIDRQAGFSITAPVGSVGTGVNAAAPLTPSFTVEALSGGLNQDISLGGMVADMLLAAPQGEVVAETAVNIAGPLSNIEIAALAGEFPIEVAVDLGPPPNVEIDTLVGNVSAQVILDGQVANWTVEALAGEIHFPVTLSGPTADISVLAPSGTVVSGSLLLRRWDGTEFKTGGRLYRWDGSSFVTGGVLRRWDGSSFHPPP